MNANGIFKIVKLISRQYKDYNSLIIIIIIR